MELKIAVIVPTVRPEKYVEFMDAWAPLFYKHKVKTFIVRDGDEPTVNYDSVKDVMGEYADLIYNHNDGVRNLGFAKAYQCGYDIFISFDDDVRPIGDPIQDHLDVLNSKVPISWMNAANEVYLRGFPYGVREEAEVVFSHVKKLKKLESKQKKNIIQILKDV
jgi:hypothetical protein